MQFWRGLLRIGLSRCGARARGTSASRRIVSFWSCRRERVSGMGKSAESATVSAARVPKIFLRRLPFAFQGLVELWEASGEVLPAEVTLSVVPRGGPR